MVRNPTRGTSGTKHSKPDLNPFVMAVQVLRMPAGQAYSVHAHSTEKSERNLKDFGLSFGLYVCM